MADRLLGFIDDAPIIAHAEYVERNILMRELARLGRAWPAKDRFVCTLKMARCSGRFAANGLRDVCADLGIVVAANRAGFHDALGDARMAALIYLALTEEGDAGTGRTARAIVVPNRRLSVGVQTVVSRRPVVGIKAARRSA